MTVPVKTLANGHTIPVVGAGLWKVTEAEAFTTMFTAAIAAGYRHFDSAQAYGNEHLLGAAWHQSGVARSELFLTTKIAVTHFGEKRTLNSFNQSLKNLQTDYVDLLLLHFPVPLLRRSSWSALEQLLQSGAAKAIGVSNYTIRHLKEMQQYAKLTPMVNQVELHVFLQQPELVQYCADNGILLEAYSPLAHAKAMDSPAIAAIASAHNKTYAQIMLRWCIERGLIVLPKSVTPQRLQQNIDIFDFSLSPGDMAAIAVLDVQKRTCWDPTHVP